MPAAPLLAGAWDACVSVHQFWGPPFHAKASGTGQKAAAAPGERGPAGGSAGRRRGEAGRRRPRVCVVVVNSQPYAPQNGCLAAAGGPRGAPPWPRCGAAQRGAAGPAPTPARCFEGSGGVGPATRQKSEAAARRARSPRRVGRRLGAAAARRARGVGGGECALASRALVMRRARGAAHAGAWRHRPARARAQSASPRPQEAGRVPQRGERPHARMRDGGTPVVVAPAYTWRGR